MINYEWNCKTVDVYVNSNNLENVIYNVHWRLKGKDSITGIEVERIGTQVLDTETINSFIPIGDLNNETITKWVKDIIGDSSINTMKESIAKEIDEKINPSRVTLTIDN